jgi:hypothetical protein
MGAISRSHAPPATHRLRPRVLLARDDNGIRSNPGNPLGAADARAERMTSGADPETISLDALVPQQMARKAESVGRRHANGSNVPETDDRRIVTVRGCTDYLGGKLNPPGSDSAKGGSNSLSLPPDSHGRAATPIAHIRHAAPLAGARPDGQVLELAIGRGAPGGRARGVRAAPCDSGQPH